MILGSINRIEAMQQLLRLRCDIKYFQAALGSGNLHPQEEDMLSNDCANAQEYLEILEYAWLGVELP